MKFELKSAPIGINCDVKDGVISFEDCILCGECLPPEMIRGLIDCHFTEKAKRYDWIKPPDRSYSVTELTGCIRSTYYSYFQDSYLDLQSQLRMQRGTALHKRYLHGFRVREKSMSIISKGWDGCDVYLTGTFDAYSDSLKHVVELKTVNGLPRSYNMVSKLYIRQLRTYLAMVGHAWKDYNSDEGELLFINGGGVPRRFVVKKEKGILDDMLKRMYLLDKAVGMTMKEQKWYIPPYIGYEEVNCLDCVHSVRCRMFEKRRV